MEVDVAMRATEGAVLYVGPDCPACATAKKFLELRGIAYVERSVEDPKVMRELVAITGKTAVPVLELPGGELLVGWDPRRWMRALDPEGVIVE
jgi:glutaredoxin